MSLVAPFLEHGVYRLRPVVIGRKTDVRTRSYVIVGLLLVNVNHLAVL